MTFNVILYTRKLRGYTIDPDMSQNCPHNKENKNMTTQTETEVIDSGNSRYEDIYIIEYVHDHQGFSGIDHELVSALNRAKKTGHIIGRMRHGVMRYYTPEYVKKYNL